MRLEEVRNFWTKVLGTQGPQWMVVMALQRLDQGNGASVRAIADTLDANPAFVTAQLRFLESKGLVQRTDSGDDAGTMMLSLTDETRRHLAELARLQDET